jgi:hypothetical protein
VERGTDKPGGTADEDDVDEEDEDEKRKNLIAKIKKAHSTWTLFSSDAKWRVMKWQNNTYRTGRYQFCSARPRSSW